MRSKYGNRKVRLDGVVFDSRKEARRYAELSLLQKAGDISDLQRQVEFELIPAQYAPSSETYKRGAQKGKQKPGKLLERRCCYIADFVYRQHGELIVEDTKGVRTKEYIIKRKLMLYVHKIAVKEI
jgi:hypothetical protein